MLPDRGTLDIMNEIDSADQYLLEQIRRGSADGWAQLVERYEGRLLAFAHGRLPRAAEAEDLVQETFISFLKALDHYQEQASLETYLFTICRNKIASWYRARRFNVCLLQDIVAESNTEGARDPLGAVPADDPTASGYARRAEAHKNQREALAVALAELINRYKKNLNFRDLRIVEMLFYCQLRNREIARHAEVSENHVALIKHRCLKQIHEQLGQARSGESPADPPDSLLSEIWQDQRLSCLKRSTIGAYLLGTLDSPWREYVAFHLDRLGCRFCRANLEDLQSQTAEEVPRQLHARIMESTVGFLHKP